VLAAIVHICAVMAAPMVYRGDAYSRLARSLPMNSFVLIPQAQWNAQILPFQMPDARYSICRFDINNGPLSIKAVLPEPGWTLALYGQSGEGFYAIPASERKTALNVMLLPPGEHFLGFVNEARNQDSELSQITAPGRRGLAVIRAPLKGRSFSAQIERDLAQSECRQVRF